MQLLSNVGLFDHVGVFVCIVFVVTVKTDFFLLLCNEILNQVLM